jgi:Glycosyl transferases group 1
MLDLNYQVAEKGWVSGRLAHITRPLVSAILKRPFSDSSKINRRIILIYMNDWLAFPMFAGFLRNTEKMKDAGIEFRGISFSEYLKSPRTFDAHAIFYQVPYFIDRKELSELAEDLRCRNPDSVISFFDWFAPCDVRFAEFVDPWVDFYVKKSLPKHPIDRISKSIGHSDIADYYSDLCGTENPPRNWNTPTSILPKLELGPAFHFSSSLFGYFTQSRCPSSIGRSIDVHARFATHGDGWYGAMRLHAKSMIDSIGDNISIASTGLIDNKLYMQELQNSKICFSPFGYGEICWRDYEAIAAGAVLLKPDMSHISTNPDIYVPFETYVPIKWDMSDLNDKIHMLLQNDQLRENIAKSAFDTVKQSVHSDTLLTLTMRLSSNS